MQDFKRKAQDAFQETIIKPVDAWSKDTIDILAQLYLTDETADIMVHNGMDGTMLNIYLKRGDEGVEDLQHWLYDQKKIMSRMLADDDDNLVLCKKEARILQRVAKTFENFDVTVPYLCFLQFNFWQIWFRQINECIELFVQQYQCLKIIIIILKIDSK